MKTEGSEPIVKKRKSVCRKKKILKKKSDSEPIGTLVLATTYGLNNLHTKFVSIGYHPNTLEAIIVVRDCLENENIILSAENGSTFFEKIDEVYGRINSACFALTNYLLGHSKEYHPVADVIITPTVAAKISLADFKILISFVQHDSNQICFTIEEFNTFYNLSNFLSAVHIYNCNHANDVFCYFKEYKAKCDELKVNVLEANSFFQPLNKEEQTHNFVKLFSEIPHLCSLALQQVYHVKDVQ